MASLAWDLATEAGFSSSSVTRSQSGRVMDQVIDGTDAHPGGPNFSYDGAGRLVEAHVPGHHLTYGYAPSGGCGPAAGRGSTPTARR